METETLINEMKALKIENPTLELDEILRIMNIKALMELTNEIEQMRLASR